MKGNINKCEIYFSTMMKETSEHPIRGMMMHVHDDGVDYKDYDDEDDDFDEDQRQS